MLDTILAKWPGSYSPVDLRLDLEKIRRKLILVSLESNFLSYPKSSKIHLRENFYGKFSNEAYVMGFEKVDLPQISNLPTITTHNFRLENGIDLKFDQ